MTDTDTVGITVNAVNDVPLNSVPAAQSLDEDTSLVFSILNGNQISVSDLDLGGGDLQVTLGVNDGTLTLAQTLGLSFTVGNGTADSTMTFTGTAASINAALDGMSFDPGTDFNGAVTLTLATDDQGNTGSGGALTDTDTVGITVNAVNDVPLNSVPAAQSMDEDALLVFSTLNGNLISVSDLDVGGADLQITLAVNDGTLTLAQLVGLSFTVGDGTADSTMTFTGTAASINAALDGMSFDPNADFNGAVTLTLATDDQGNTGSGGALADTDTVGITVNAVNDAPLSTVPVAQNVDEDGSLVFSILNGNLISVSDLDLSGADLQVTLGVNDGTLTLAQTLGLSFTVGDGSADSAMTFTGTAASINAALDGMSFDPNADFNGAVTLTLATDDQGTPVRAER